MADLTATEPTPWLDVLQRMLGHVKDIAKATTEAPGMGASPATALLSMLGQAAGSGQAVAERAAYGEPQFTGRGETLTAKPELVDTLMNVIPQVKGVAAALAGAKGATFLGLPAVRALMESGDTAAVQKLLAARNASATEYATSRSLPDAWAAGSRHLEGTPYAGWLPGHDQFPSMFEVSDAGAKLFRPTEAASTYAGRLGDYYSHPELEKIMPNMGRIPFKAEQGPALDEGGLLTLKPSRSLEIWGTRESLPGTMKHEGQHLVAAEVGGVPQGTSTKHMAEYFKSQYPNITPASLADVSFQSYQNAPGEMLARLAELRGRYSPDAIRLIDPVAQLLAEFDPSPMKVVQRFMP